MKRKAIADRMLGDELDGRAIGTPRNGATGVVAVLYASITGFVIRGWPRIMSDLDHDMVPTDEIIMRRR